MSRGKRYTNEPKLNIKKVIAVILVFIVLIGFFITLRKLIKSDGEIIKTTEYYALHSNNKWGVIDSNGSTVIEPTYDEMIIIPDHTKDLFICLEDVNYDNGTYTSKILNAKGKEILSDKKQVQAIENYDKNNDLWYEKNVLKYENNGKYGVINFQGKVLLQPEFEQINSLKGIEGVLITKKDGKVGLVSNEGNKIIPNNYTEIKSLGKDTNLYIVKDEKNNYGIYDKIEAKYQDIKELNNKDLYCVKENNKYKVINKDEEVIFNNKVDEIIQIKDNVIIFKNNKKYGAYIIDSNTTIKAKYDQITYTSNENMIVKKGDSYGIININEAIAEKINYANIIYYEKSQVYELEEKNNTSGENKILNNNLEQIAQGILDEVNDKKAYIRLWTENGYKYYSLSGEEKESKDILLQNNLFLSKQNGKYGYIDREGNVIVEHIYDDAKEQNLFGFAAVKKDGKWGAIDSKGNIIEETSNNLDDNLIIDFIGKYHLGKDINLIYYTD